MKPKILQRAVLSMSEIKTKSNVRELSVRQRKCKFFSDGGLKTWPVYSRSMCVTECRMKVIQDHCDCRPHFARPTGLRYAKIICIKPCDKWREINLITISEGVNICNATQLHCIGRITKELFLYEYPPSFCTCIPKCDVVSYQIRDNDASELYFIQINLHCSIESKIHEIINVFSFCSQAGYAHKYIHYNFNCRTSTSHLLSFAAIWIYRFPKYVYAERRGISINVQVENV